MIFSWPDIFLAPWLGASLEKRKQWRNDLSPAVYPPRAKPMAPFQWLLVWFLDWESHLHPPYYRCIYVQLDCYWDGYNRHSNHSPQKLAQWSLLPRPNHPTKSILYLWIELSSIHISYGRMPLSSCRLSHRWRTWFARNSTEYSSPGHQADHVCFTLQQVLAFCCGENVSTESVTYDHWAFDLSHRDLWLDSQHLAITTRKWPRPGHLGNWLWTQTELSRLCPDSHNLHSRPDPLASTGPTCLPVWESWSGSY